jgi:hypothetical protein
MSEGAEAKAIALLEAMNHAIRAARFDELETYSAKLETILSDLQQVDVRTLERLRNLAGRNADCLEAAAQGLRAGRRRLVEIAAAERAVKLKRPLVLFSAAGGARMQEGILSLMQMPRTTVAVQMLKEANLPYIVVLTHPTTGGVTASYAMLGDVQIAEPNALICFAGPRVIEQTIREKLPEGFQRAEYLLDHGMLDRVTHRKALRDELIILTRLLMQLPPAVRGDLPPPGNIAPAEPAETAEVKA